MQSLAGVVLALILGMMAVMAAGFIFFGAARTAVVTPDSQPDKTEAGSWADNANKAGEPKNRAAVPASHDPEWNDAPAGETLPAPARAEILELRAEVAARDAEIEQLKQRVAQLQQEAESPADEKAEPDAAVAWATMAGHFEKLSDDLRDKLGDYYARPEADRTTAEFSKVINRIQQDTSSALMPWALELIRIAKDLQGKSDRLFFDEAYFPGLMASFYEKSMPLTAAETDDMQRLAGSLAARYAGGLSTSAATPATVFKARLDLLRDFHDQWFATLSRERVEKAAAIRDLVSIILPGSQMAWGIGVEQVANLDERVLARLQESYQLTEPQRQTMAAALLNGQYAYRAVAILQTLGQFQPERPALSMNQEEAMTRQLLDLQVEVIEPALAGALTAEQKKAANIPLLIVPMYGAGTNIVNMNNMGY